MEDLTGLLAVFMIFMIPIVALLIGGLKMWIDFKSKQEKLGTSTHDLEEAVQQLEADRAALRRRVENLEAIVTSEEWDALPESEKCSGSFLSLSDSEAPSSEQVRRRGERSQRPSSR